MVMVVQTLLPKVRTLRPHVREALDLYTRLKPVQHRPPGRYCASCGRGPLHKYQRCRHTDEPRVVKTTHPWQHTTRRSNTDRTPRKPRTGVTAEEHRVRVEAGERWCGGHQAYHPASEFGAGWSCRAYHRDAMRAHRAARQEG